jgi:hypothetical protein
MQMSREPLDSAALRKIADEATKFAEQHIVAISEEMLEWRNTSLLRNGRVRELAQMLEPLADSYALSVAESYAQRAAFEFVVQQGKTTE